MSKKTTIGIVAVTAATVTSVAAATGITLWVRSRKGSGRR